MAITVTSNIQSAAAAASSTPVSGIVLQAGQVITAEVVQVLGNGQVQIAIGNQTIEAATQVPLQVGQSLQLQVSQTASGIGLAIVNQPSAATGQAGAGGASAGGAATSDAVITLSPSLAASLAANLTPDAATPSNPLSPIEISAVSIAAQTAVTQQTSLAPLFADLDVAAGLPNLPPQVQQAVAQVLAQQIPLDQDLTADTVKQAFQSSGLLLEASLASGSALASNGVPDLKAALIVLRQALTSALSDVTETAAPASASAPQAAASQAAAATTGSISTPASANGPQQAVALTAAALLESGELIADAGVLSATAAAELTPQEALLGAPSTALLTGAAMSAPAASAQSSALGAAQEILELAAGSQTLVPTATPADAAARAAASTMALNFLQEAVQATPLAAANLSQLLSENGEALALLPVVTGARAPDDAEFARTNLPPPPISGALPAAQPVAPATLSGHMPLNTALQHLLDDTDGAIARQTLLQIASLPGQADVSASRIDAATPRWNFEIPFATPQGTAMAQFEISRDGGGREASAAKAVWRARFSLNVEPAGPVHALVSLNGDRTSVRMWAERPATASQLRAGVSQLTQALSRAELTPGDIVIRDGAPQQAAAAPAGHFLDRAS
jgi:Flagellar hook-length control protein FliK